MHVESNTFTSSNRHAVLQQERTGRHCSHMVGAEPGDYIEITDTLETRTAENYAMYSG